MGRREPRRRSGFCSSPESRSRRPRSRPATRESHRTGERSPERLQRPSAPAEIPWLKLTAAVQFYIAPNPQVVTKTAADPSAVFVFQSAIIQPLAGWRGPRRWRRNNLWQIRRSAAVLAFMLMIFPPFRRRVPCHPQGYWLAEPGSTDFSLCRFCLTSKASSPAASAHSPSAPAPNHPNPPNHPEKHCCFRRSHPKTQSASRHLQKSSCRPSAPS